MTSYKLMINCKEATLLSVKKSEGKLLISERLKLILHLAICQYCRLFNKQIKLIGDFMGSINASQKLSDNDKETLKLELEKRLK